MSAAPPLAERIATAFPGIGPVAPLRTLGSGFRSEVVETARGIAVKVGQIPDAGDDYAREWRALPVLAGGLTVPIPRPRWHAPPGAAFPALAYPVLPGRRPPRAGSAMLARTLGEFLAELHALPESVAHAAGLEP